jgi:endonuclease/exonuclease/phosphatase (EEP) superfamily protein YafD
MLLRAVLPFFLFSLAFGPGIPLAQGTTFLWWNIGGANFLEPNNPDVDYQPTELAGSLLATIDRHHPEVVVLAEYFTGFLSKETLRQIRQRLPYSRQFKNNTISPMGLLFFSKHKPLTIQYEFEKLPWRTGTLTENRDLKRPGYLRSFVKIDLKTEDGRLVHLAPFHSNQPWNEIGRDQKGLSQWNHRYGLGKLPGQVETLGTLVSSLNHPLGYQAKAFAQHWQSARKKSSGQGVWMLMGDLNIFDTYLWTPPTLKVLKGDLNPGWNVGSLVHSFPVPHTYLTDTKVRIDHVFSNLLFWKLRYQYLNVRGSDHYPLLVEF